MGDLGQRRAPFSVCAHENLFHCRPASAVWAALIVPLFATIAAPPAAAQITAPTGTSVTVPPNTTITCADCVALSVPGPAPPGTIIALGPFTLNVTSTSVFTAGANTQTGSGGVITLENGTINATSTSPFGAQGVISQSGTITGTNVNVDTQGFSSQALVASSGGQVIWSGGTVTTTGGGTADAIFAFSGGKVVATGTTFNVTQGVEVSNGAAVELHNVTMTSTSFGIFGHDAFGPTPSTVLVDGGSLTAVRPFGVFGAPGPATVTFNVQNALVNTLVSSTGLVRLMQVTDGSTGILNASSSTLTGSIFTEPGSTTNVNLTNGTRWNVTGPENSNVSNLTNNASTIQFAPPTGDPTLLSSYKTLTAVNYTGQGGTLGLNTFLGADGSPSDRLVINGGSATGSSSLRITNAGGPGAETVANGIQVVQAINGGTSASGAFSLQGGSITAGAFDYFLFKGGASPESQGNWYLRSTLIAPLTPDVPPPEAAPGSPPLPTPVPGAAPIPLFQPGVAVMSVVPSVARTLGLLTLATFNERQGDQLLARDGTKIGAWGRVFGQNTREHFAQGARPDFDGSFAGFQAGADLWRLESSNGHHDNIGFYVAQARASGTVHGSVDGFEGALAGHVDLDASSYGGYWTHLGPSNWYIDTVVQGTHFIGTPQSIRGVSTRVNGDAFAGSIEAGYPIVLAPWLIFEPQVQGIWQRVWLDQALVPFATISFDRADVFTGRAGALLRGSFGSGGAQWQPYLKGMCGGAPMASTRSRSIASASRQGATAAPRSKAVVVSPAS
jgi:outer membrane autotransporter protein